MRNVSILAYASFALCKIDGWMDEWWQVSTGQADTEGPHVYDDCQISRAWISLLFINQEEIYKLTSIHSHIIRCTTSEPRTNS
jgi:hypothetical protein